MTVEKKRERRVTIEKKKREKEKERQQRVTKPERKDQWRKE